MSSAAAAADAVQVVTFAIGAEVFAVPVAQVREILDYRAPFHLPGAPAHFLGLIDVRGVGVPTIDLRLRLGLPPAEPTALTRILIVELATGGDDTPRLLGLLIDRALVVSAFARSAIEPAPEIGVRWRSDYITGVVRGDNGFTVLVDIPRILSAEDSALIAAGPHAHAA